MARLTFNGLPKKGSVRTPPTYAVHGLNSKKVSPFLIPFASYGGAKRDGYSSYSKSLFSADYGLKLNVDLNKVHYTMVDPINSPVIFNETWYSKGTSSAVNFLVGAGLGVVSLVAFPMTATAASIAYAGFTAAIDSAVASEIPRARQGDQLWMYHLVGKEASGITAVWQYWLVDPFRNKKTSPGPGAWLIAEERTDNIWLHDSVAKG